MRYLLLADVHANLEALKTVLEKAKSIGYDSIIVLGDLADYGAEPNECIELLRKEENAIILQGNHDAADSELIEVDWFNEDAKKCIEWTRGELSSENKEFLKELPKFFSIPFLLAVHASPFDPYYEYMNEESAKKSLDKVPEHTVVCGHNHKCFQYTTRNGLKEFTKSTFISLDERSVISLPSVGQPRDGNPQTGFALIDFEKKEMRIERVSYDVEKTVGKILETDLPKALAERLKKGN